MLPGHMTTYMAPEMLLQPITADPDTRSRQSELCRKNGRNKCATRAPWNRFHLPMHSVPIILVYFNVSFSLFSIHLFFFVFPFIFFLSFFSLFRNISLSRSLFLTHSFPLYFLSVLTAITVGGVSSFGHDLPSYSNAILRISSAV